MFVHALRHRLKFGPVLVSAVLTVLLIGFYFSAARFSFADRITTWREAAKLVGAQNPISTPSSNHEPDLPPLDYQIVSGQTPFCERRFSPKYLEDIRNHTVPYCKPESRSHLTCFFSHTRTNDGIDPFCFAQGASLNAQTGRFEIPCSRREFTEQDRSNGGVDSPGSLRTYWYETGPGVVFGKAIDLQDRSKAIQRSDGGRETRDDDATNNSGVEVVHIRPPKRFILLKREGESNMWHCLMEIFSMYMSIDVLHISRDHNGERYFHVPEDSADTQVVILDERLDGPYYDLWTLFAKRPILRMKDLLADRAAVDAAKDVDLIVPLAGSSNPLWQEDIEVQRCRNAPNLAAFVNRVTKFYQIPEPPEPKPEDPIIVTFIDRNPTRKLLHNKPYFEELKKRVPHIEVRFSDFALISFPEQLRIARETDVLVGVHGAGLTHAMFMREGVSAVVEIQPNELGHFGFRNIAAMRDLTYFRVHAQSVPQNDTEGWNMKRRKRDHMWSRRDWHTMDIEIEMERFLDVMDAAIKSVYAKGARSFDVN